jgi:TPR repeat protein
MLGAAYLLGTGVPRDGVAALAWLLRASAGGSALAARFLNNARGTLSADQIGEAERRAAAPAPEAAP